MTTVSLSHEPQKRGSSVAFGTAMHGAGLPFLSAAAAQTSSKTKTQATLVRQDRVWLCRATVANQKAARGEDLAWHRSERH